MSDSEYSGDEQFEPLEGTLRNVIEQNTLKWIFVGGKGGVGKTTTSCSLASQLAKVRKSVLLISTDPAHNLSDAFGQKFGKKPLLVNGYDNLYAMEIDPQSAAREMFNNNAPTAITSTYADLMSSLPGVDEALGFAEVMKLVKSLEYSAVVFDTAPTGHTLRFLTLPSALDNLLKKFGPIKNQFKPLFDQMTSGLGQSDINSDNTFDKLDEISKMVEEVNTQFKDPELTTFVCVCISEFLSLYETERLIQDLSQNSIDTHNIVVNQLLFPKKDSECEQCLVRHKMQQKYLEQIYDLYEDFHIVTLPLKTYEIRGSEEIKKFSEMLLTPFVPYDEEA
ncbi:anion-transporting ATPase [Conidiobolus coronatus NRRL 28638]|uniref:Anion-transporting ATPase n=1 Tax=Conidiobolus coronatus (strain ATCC 28846 / CBS 209.66 / NRRL 28638) TaxID=796925 RepID=A0A137NY15_CONC2|nr:anion-transporting ATPase [Conidiobolus coronatus NRRL 28638]|eukprot:KXN67489.1 anion-transporting ATPase [Conidiobolus coronatus NRRL 28638]